MFNISIITCDNNTQPPKPLEPSVARNDKRHTSEHLGVVRVLGNSVIQYNEIVDLGCDVRSLSTKHPGTCRLWLHSWKTSIRIEGIEESLALSGSPHISSILLCTSTVCKAAKTGAMFWKSTHIPELLQSIKKQSHSSQHMWNYHGKSSWSLA